MNLKIARCINTKMGVFVRLNIFADGIKGLIFFKIITEK